MNRTGMEMDIYLLIAEVYKRRALWKQGHPHHHHRGVLDKLWSEVGEIVGVTTTQARKRWKNLKDHYRNELRRVTESELGTGAQYKSFWGYYDSLNFLASQIAPRKQLSTLATFAREIKQQAEENFNLSNDNQTFPFDTNDAIESKSNISQFSDEKSIPLVNFEVSDSDDYHFFMSLIPHMRQFDTIQKLTIRNKIQQVIIDHTNLALNSAPDMNLLQ